MPPAGEAGIILNLTVGLSLSHLGKSTHFGLGKLRPEPSIGGPRHNRGPTMVETWTGRIWREFHAKTLTRAYRDVMSTLHSYRGRRGLAFPSHETLASRAGCKVRTVGRALKHARTLGLVSWVKRRVRQGWRSLRTSNLYWMGVPDTPVDPSMRPVWRRHATTGQNDRGGERVRKQEAHEGHKAQMAVMVAEAAGFRISSRSGEMRLQQCS